MLSMECVYVGSSDLFEHVCTFIEWTVVLSISHMRANLQAKSSTSYELGWFAVNRKRFPVHP